MQDEHAAISVESEKKAGTLERLTQMFRRSKTLEDLPAQSEPYTGPLSTTGRLGDLPAEPIHSLVSIYSAGRSDEPTTASSIVITTTSAQQYPSPGAPFKGPVPETLRRAELEGESLDQHVTAYHPGRSDLHEAVPQQIAAVEDARKAKEGALERLTHLFKRPAAHDDFPVSEQYTGPLAETSRLDELHIEPLEGMVTVYSSGRSDEALPVAEAAELADYPSPTLAYEGPISGITRRTELEASPLDVHVASYHHGRSDLEPRALGKMTTKITSIFKKSPQELHEFPPITLPYEGPLSETGRTDELNRSPLEHQVTAYSIGHYDQLEPQRVSIGVGVKGHGLPAGLSPHSKRSS